MKVTVENKKGLSKDLKVIIDKKTMDSYLNDKYEEIKKNFTLKGFRPGKAPIIWASGGIGRRVGLRNQ